MEHLRNVSSVKELAEVCKDTPTLVKILMDAGLLMASQNCKVCNRDMKLKKVAVTKKSDCYKWTCLKTNSCPGSEISVRNGSIFEGSKLLLKDALVLIFLWAQRTPCTGIANVLGLSKPTIYAWAETLRGVALETVSSRSAMIGGVGQTVEIDESCVTKRKYNRGRVSDNNQVWIVGALSL
uniref:ISXO2-like transposase domain-containing protein n=1 Tax=Anopheles albimanus TaxID=7167 RepID=A0A182FD74_ANOAL